ncbi:MAG: hypothetical protein ABSH20_08310 [Tepidisphaeraceae bacterium]
MPAAEAQAIRIKLESHGIPSELDDADTSADASLQAANRTEFVSQTDLESARTALAEPDKPDDPDDKIEDEYYIDKWVCPQCHHPGLYLVPLTAGLRRVRNAFFVMLALPFILLVLELVIPSRTFWEPIEGVIFPEVASAWLLVCFTMVCVLCGARRNRRCLECGWELHPGSATATRESIESTTSSEPDSAP